MTSTVFERGSLVPSAKMLTFYRSEAFTVKAEYTQDSDIPATADRSIGERACHACHLAKGLPRGVVCGVVIQVGGKLAAAGGNQGWLMHRHSSPPSDAA